MLTIEEKAGLVGPDPAFPTDFTRLCTVVTAPVPRLGLGPYLWLVEANTGVASACLGPNMCATTFSGPEGLGATFNRSLWYAKGDVISTEMRAFNNAGGVRFSPGSGFGIGLTGFGPNINLAAHPLWGRNSEVPGEDPYLSGMIFASSCFD
jgi:beta-glucosidase-like glycosyl hydrolase